MGKKKKSGSHKVTINPAAETFGMVASFLGGGAFVYFGSQTEPLWCYILPIFGIAFICFGIHSFFNLLYYYGKVKDQSILATIGVIIALIAFLLTSYYIFFRGINFLSRSEQVDAEVISIGGEVNYKYDQDDNSVREDNCTTEISYVVGGKTYTTNLDSKSCKYEKGQTIPIRYDKDSPDKMASGTILEVIIGLSFGLLITFIFIGYIIATIKNKRKHLTKA